MSASLGRAGFRRSVALLCLPSVAVAAFAVRFLVADVPRMEEDERGRVRDATALAAAELRRDPSLADFAWERGRGVVEGLGVVDPADFPSSMSWKEWAPQSGRKSRDMWGWRDTPKGRLVWTRGAGDDGDRVYGAFRQIAERPWAAMFRIAVPAFLAVLAWITAAGVRYFAGYVRSRDDFLAATAHDLSTPLVAMRYLIGCSPAEAEALNERMLRLVANVKDFLRLGGRRPRPASEPFDPVAAWEEAYSLFRDDYRDAFDGADVPLDASGLGGGADGAGRAMALGDATLAVQILWNLLGNDLKYAAPHGPVRARMEASGGFVRVSLEDEGPGMSPGEMRRAFDRYWRARTVLESGRGGFGIGLCTARESARAMGGSLEVRANVPRGCVFTLSLPLAPTSSTAGLSRA